MSPKIYRAPRAAADPSQPKTPRKHRAAAPMPPGWTSANWAADLARRRTVTTDRRNRGVMKKSRDKVIMAEEASHATMAQNAANANVAAAERRVNTRPTPSPPPPPPHHKPSPHHQPSPHHLVGPPPPHLAGQYVQGMWPSHQRVASPSNYSPLVWMYSTSPEYADGDPHGRFNPNTTFVHFPPPRPTSGLSVDIYVGYSCSPTYSTPSLGLRRGALPFVASASMPQFAAEMDDLIKLGSNAAASSPEYMDSWEEDVIGLETQETFGEQSDVQAEETQEEGEEEPAPTAKGRKTKRQASTGLNEPRFKWPPKEDECLAKAWKTVSIDPITGANQNGDNYWKRIRDGAHVRHVPRENNDLDFKFLHVFTKIESCEKWTEVRLPLVKTKDDVYDPDAPAPAASAGRPEGHKQAKATKARALAVERVQAAIEQCIADANTHTLAKEKMAIAREEKSDARWSELMKKSDMKLELLKRNVAAKKRNTDLAFLQAGNPTTMTPQVAAWWKAECDLILNHMSATRAEEPEKLAPTSPSMRSAAEEPPASAPTAPPSTTPSSPIAAEDEVVTVAEDEEVTVVQDEVIDV
ncbi:unnamed protein product [Alopecurus aequalis]